MSRREFGAAFRVTRITAGDFEEGIWTEDPDFFASGMAAWTTDQIQLPLRL